MKYLLLILCLSGPPAWACNSPAQLEPVGEAQLRHWGFRLYTARTFSCRGEALARDGRVSGPFALSITYDRSIASTALVQATRTQWQALGLMTDHSERWLAQLQQLWPDVQQGDQLTLFIDAAGESQFLLGDQLLGRLVEPEFGPLFAAIWLHPESRFPAARAALMGAS